jgi:predicted nucleic acid-binding protein
MYLVDTNVISTAAPSKTRGSAEVAAWIEAASHHLYLSVVTVAEVEDGIAKCFREGARAKASAILEWWSAVEHLYGDRIIHIDIEVAHAAGRLLDHARSKGHTPGFADVAIAATARVRALTILTENVRHFEPLGVAFVNPFDRLPALPP